jgi:RHS repeat-associated protein
MYWTKDNLMQSYNNLQTSFRNAVTQGVSDIKYFLVNDRLGSGTVVTNQNGGTVQVLCAHTFGDDLLDLNNGYETPYQVFGYEVDMESNLNYANARYYLGKRGKLTFNSTDPLWYMYPHLSPYAYCANNPIMFVDKTGEWIVGTDNKRVTYSKENGWSANASADVRRVGDAMMRTNTGAKTLEKMMSVKYPISITIQKKGKSPEEPNRLGVAKTTVRKDTWTDGTVTQSIQSVDIIFYEEVIKETMDIYNKASDYIDRLTNINFTEEEKKYMELCPNMDDMYNLNGTHEGEHATNKKANSNFVSKKTAEKAATEAEMKSLQELINQKSEE